MIASWMLFLMLVSLVLAGAAWMAERGLRGLGLPARWVWAVALVAGPAWMAGSLLLPSMALEGGSAAVPGVVVELPALVVGGGPDGSLALETVLLALWLLAGAGLLASLAWGTVRLARDRRRWRPATVLGRDILVSDGVGPAVAGLLRPRIVVPAWVLDLPDAHLALVLEHEEEHRRARDPQLLAVALLGLTAAAWNPVAWWLLRRLRSAVEIDCDGRVLRRGRPVHAYGSSLLQVARRAGRPHLALAAFAESPHTLERRLTAMTTRISTRSRWTGAFLVAVAILLAAQACGVESPVAETASIEEEPRLTRSTAELAAAPTFTPFTEAPQITNRAEVIEAMEREYPPLLRDAGVGGTVRVYFFITETGEVGERRLDMSSGHEALDQAALNVASVYRFTPALNRDERVPVWVSFPITFQVR